MMLGHLSQDRCSNIAPPMVTARAIDVEKPGAWAAQNAWQEGQLEGRPVSTAEAPVKEAGHLLCSS